MFKLDKRYYVHHDLLEKLKIEGWEYIELSGKYSDVIENEENGIVKEEEPTHKNKFRFFCEQIENLKKKLLDAEFSTIENKQKNKQLPITPGRANMSNLPEINLESIKESIQNAQDQGQNKIKKMQNNLKKLKELCKADLDSSNKILASKFKNYIKILEMKCSQDLIDKNIIDNDYINFNNIIEDLLFES